MSIFLSNFSSSFDIWICSCRELVELGHGSKDSVPRRQLFAGTGSKAAIVFPPVVTAQWEEQVHSHTSSHVVDS